MRLTFRALYFLVLLVGLFPTLAAAQPTRIPKTLSLKETLRIADQRGVRIIISQERVKQALARIGQSRSELLPQLNANSFQNRQTRDLRTAGFAFPGDPLVGPFNVFDARVQITQSLFDAAALARLKSAQAGRALSLAESRQTREDVLTLVSTMYITARRSAQSVDYANAVVAREELKLKLARERLKAGTGSELEVRQAAADHAGALRARQQSQSDAAQANTDLLVALGFDPTETIQFSDDAGWALPVPEEQPVDSNLDHLPDVDVALRQTEISRLNQAAEQKEFLPKISALADYGPSGVNPSDENNTYTLGLRASLPIFDGGLRYSRLKEAESQVRESEAVADDVKHQAHARILNAVESFHQALALVVDADAQQAVAQQQLALVRQRLKNGTANELDFADAQAREAAAVDQNYEARAVLLTAQINWIRATGKMDDLLNGLTEGSGPKE